MNEPEIVIQTLPRVDSSTGAETAEVTSVRHRRAPVTVLTGVLDLDDSFLDFNAEDRHDDSVTALGSIRIEVAGDMGAMLFGMWLRSTLLFDRLNLVRATGIAPFSPEPNRWVFQSGHTVLDSTEGAPWGKGERWSNRGVFVERNLDRSIREGFRSCAVQEDRDFADGDGIDLRPRAVFHAGATQP